MDMLSRLIEPQYFYVTRDAEGKQVDMGYVPVSLAQGLIHVAQRAGCVLMLVVSNTTRH
jgi:hypothetical protein